MLLELGAIRVKSRDPSQRVQVTIQVGDEIEPITTSKSECGEVSFDVVRAWFQERHRPLLIELPSENRLPGCKVGANTTDDEPDFDFEVLLLLCTLTTPGKLVSYAPPSIYTSTSAAVYVALLEFARTSTTCVVWKPQVLDDYTLIAKSSEALAVLAEECLQFGKVDIAIPTIEKLVLQAIENGLDSGEDDYYLVHLIFGMILGYNKSGTLSYFQRGHDADFDTKIARMYTVVSPLLTAFLTEVAKVHDENIVAMTELIS